MLNRESQKTDRKPKESIKSAGKAQEDRAHHRLARRPMRPKVAQNVQHGQIPAQEQETRIGEDDLVEGLSQGNFREVAWPGVILNGCDASGADFSAATLTDLCALGANLINVQFEEAQLQNAALCGSNLTAANLRNADLRNTNLAWCNLRGANLFAVDLRYANLTWADLREADLQQANLKGAYYNFRTQWPADFDPIAHQMVCLT